MLPIIFNSNSVVVEWSHALGGRKLFLLINISSAITTCLYHYFWLTMLLSFLLKNMALKMNDLRYHSLDPIKISAKSEILYLVEV